MTTVESRQLSLQTCVSLIRDCDRLRLITYGPLALPNHPRADTNIRLDNSNPPHPANPVN